MNGVLEGEGVASSAGGVSGAWSKDRFAIGGSGFEQESGSARDKDDLIEGHGDVDDIANAVGAVRSGGVNASDGGLDAVDDLSFPAKDVPG